MQNPRIEELTRRDPRYAPEAYQFVFDALDYATRRLEPRTARTPPAARERERKRNTFPWRSSSAASASWPCATSA